jgi:hypothetical protein
MPKLDEAKIRKAFASAVNMSVAGLNERFATEESRKVGWTGRRDCVGECRPRERRTRAIRQWQLPTHSCP